jgi:hypothetical protein
MLPCYVYGKRASVPQLWEHNYVGVCARSSGIVYDACNSVVRMLGV